MKAQIFATQLNNKIFGMLWRYLGLVSIGSREDIMQHIETAAVTIDDLVHSYKRTFDAELNQLLEYLSPQHLSLLHHCYAELRNELEKLHEKLKLNAPLDETAQQFFSYLHHASKLFILQRNIIVQIGQIVPLNKEIKMLLTALVNDSNVSLN